MNTFLRTWLTKSSRPQVVITGNEKGGSGKSTLAIHLICGLMSAGFQVGSIDLDGRQATLSHFIENRRRKAFARGNAISVPPHRRVSLSRDSREAEAGDEKLDQVVTALESLSDADFIVVDTPGSDSMLCRAAHILADILVTPLNPSHLDLDALVEVDKNANRIIGPSLYSELVLYMMKKRIELRAGPLKWIVVLNRLPNVDTKVNRSVNHILRELSPRLGFDIAPGVHDRIIFRELFLQGLTVFDIAKQGPLMLPQRGLSRGLKEMEQLIRLLAHRALQGRAQSVYGT